MVGCDGQAFSRKDWTGASFFPSVIRLALPRPVTTICQAFLLYAPVHNELSVSCSMTVLFDNKFLVLNYPALNLLQKPGQEYHTHSRVICIGE